jgi:3-oxoisoapionate kinase
VNQSPPLLLAFYGDDFSGSTDAMESLALSGIRTVLFLEPPTPATLARYEGVRAVGLAGVSRSLARGQMDRELPAAFSALAELQPPLVHYKVCSTFDSSPDIGSIGRAIEIGREVFACDVVPLVVGAPVLGRYCVFGNLFARSGLDSPVYRLDRHPTMSRHPITPMHESDLREVLARQTDCRVGLVDLSHLASGIDACRRQTQELIRDRAEVILIDTSAEEQLPVIGRLVWEMATQGDRRDSLFTVGSSGLGYALTAHWRECGLLNGATFGHRRVPPERIAVVSGSCSPVTDRQIEFAVEHGFTEIALDPVALLEPDAAKSSAGDAVHGALVNLEAGKSVILHTSRGPDDPRIAAVREVLGRRSGAPSTAECLGSQLGRILRELIERSGLRRVAVTGGDTGGYVARQLGVEGLELVAPVAPGSPLCRIHAAKGHEAMYGKEIAFKGGQVGLPDYLVRVRDGHGGGPRI